MRTSTLLFTMVGVGMLAPMALAQPPAEPGEGGPPPRNPELRQKILDTFDTNKDGTLDQAERQAMRRAMREFFGGGGPPEGRGPEGAPRAERRRAVQDGDRTERGAADRGPEGRRSPAGERRLEAERDRQARRGREGRGPEGRGPGGPPPLEARRGPGGPEGRPFVPRPERLFNAFDEDQNGSLSREEFARVVRFMGERFAFGPPRGEFRRGPGGPGGPEGPPPHERGRRDGPRRPDRPPRPSDPPADIEGPPPSEEAI